MPVQRRFDGGWVPADQVVLADRRFDGGPALEGQMALASRSTGYPVGAFAPPPGMAAPGSVAAPPVPAGSAVAGSIPTPYDNQVIGPKQPGQLAAQKQADYAAMQQAVAAQAGSRPFGGGPAVGGLPSSTMSGSDVDRIMAGMAARQQQQAQMAAIQRAQQGGGFGQPRMGGEHPAFGMLRQLFMQRLGGMPWGQGGGQMNILPATGANDPRAQFMRMLQQWMGGQRGA